MNPEIVEKNAMNVVQVKQALERIQKGLDEGAELNFRAGKTLDYVQDFAKLKPKQAEELADKLVALEIPRMRDVHVHKLIDLMPRSEKQVKMILSNANFTITGENVKKIFDVIKEY